MLRDKINRRRGCLWTRGYITTPRARGWADGLYLRQVKRTSNYKYQQVTIYYRYIHHSRRKYEEHFVLILIPQHSLNLRHSANTAVGRGGQAQQRRKHLIDESLGQSAGVPMSHWYQWNVHKKCRFNTDVCLVWHTTAVSRKQMPSGSCTFFLARNPCQLYPTSIILYGGVHYD